VLDKLLESVHHVRSQNLPLALVQVYLLNKLYV